MTIMRIPIAGRVLCCLAHWCQSTSLLWLMMGAASMGFGTVQELKKLELGVKEPVLASKPFAIETTPWQSYQELPFLPGEKIEYQAIHETMLSRILAGHCAIYTKTIDRVAGSWALGFRLEAKSASWYEWAFKIRDSIEGFFEVSSNKILFLDLKKEEGSYTQDRQVQFDYASKLILTKDSSEGEVKYKQYRINREVFDPYSILFLIRRQNLRVDYEIRYAVYASGKVYDFHAKVLSKEKIALGRRQYETFKVKMLTKVTGAMEQRGDILIYFTADQHKVPILVEADVKIGVFALELKKWTPGKISKNPKDL